MKTGSAFLGFFHIFGGMGSSVEGSLPPPAPPPRALEAGKRKHSLSSPTAE